MQTTKTNSNTAVSEDTGYSCRFTRFSGRCVTPHFQFLFSKNSEFHFACKSLIQFQKLPKFRSSDFKVSNSISFLVLKSKISKPTKSSPSDYKEPPSPSLAPSPILLPLQHPSALKRRSSSSRPRRLNTVWPLRRSSHHADPVTWCSQGRGCKPPTGFGFNPPKSPDLAFPFVSGRRLPHRHSPLSDHLRPSPLSQ